MASGTKTKAAPKPVAPTEKQRAVLDALSGGRVVKINDDGKRKTVALTTAKGTAVKDAPKLDRSAIESCQKKGWVGTDGTITDAGKKAKRVK